MDVTITFLKIVESMKLYLASENDKFIWEDKMMIYAYYTPINISPNMILK